VYRRDDHIRLIAVHYLKHSLRGGAGIIFIFVGLVTGLLCAQIVLSSFELAQDTGVAVGDVIKVADEGLRRFSSLPGEQVAYLTTTKPAVISAFIVLMMYCTAMLAVLGGFNQLSGDIGSKGLRYLVQRTERTKLFLGRLIGAYLLTLVVFLLVFVIVAAFMIGTITMYPAADMILWLAEGYLRLAVLALPYTALCAWLSGAIDSPFGTLAIALAVILLVPAILGMAGTINPEVGDVLAYFHPGGYKWWLLHPSPGKGLAGTGVMVGFAALFTWLGARHFERRDL